MQSANSKIETSKRVSITVPDDVLDVFNWLVKYEPKYKGVEAAVAADLMRAGAAALYNQRLQQAQPLDEEVQRALAEHSAGAFRKALGR